MSELFEPEFDSDGDITDKTFNAIKDWKPPKDWNKLFGFIDLCFDINYGRIDDDGRLRTYITGGWSCNERVIQAIESNYIFMAMFWQSSHRGGKIVFEVK